MVSCRLMQWNFVVDKEQSELKESEKCQNFFVHKGAVDVLGVGTWYGGWRVVWELAVNELTRCNVTMYQDIGWMCEEREEGECLRGWNWPVEKEYRKGCKRVASIFGRSWNTGLRPLGIGYRIGYFHPG